MEKIRALKVEPGKHPEAVDLVNNVGALRAAVSIGANEIGNIERLSISKNIVLIMNEEGKLNGMRPNRFVGRDVIFGVYYVCAVDRKGELTSLPEKEIEKYTKYFWPIDFFSDEFEAFLKGLWS